MSYLLFARVTFTHDHFCRNELVQYVIESLFKVVPPALDWKIAAF